MELFVAAAGISSGLVPRDVWPGIVWGEDEEAEFGKMVLEWAKRFPKVADDPKARASTEQSARWAIELQLLRSTIAREAEAAAKLSYGHEKQAIHDRWLRTYGAELTSVLVRAVKDPALRSPDLGRRL